MEYPINAPLKAARIRGSFLANRRRRRIGVRVCSFPDQHGRVSQSYRFRILRDDPAIAIRAIAIEE